jgi:hypothetical protein
VATCASSRRGILAGAAAWRRAAPRPFQPEEIDRGAEWIGVGARRFPARLRGWRARLGLRILVLDHA